MKLVLMEHYNQASRRLLFSLNKASITYFPVSIIYDGFAPRDILNPFAQAIGADLLADKALHFNQIKVPRFFEIRNLDGQKAEILQGDQLRAYVLYASNQQRLVKKVIWLNSEGQATLAECYNRQGFKYADVLYNAKGQAVKEIYYDSFGKKVLTYDLLGHNLLGEIKGQQRFYPSLSLFVKEFIEQYQEKISEIIINSLSIPCEVIKLLPGFPSTLYFQEEITTEIPANLSLLLSGKTSTSRILFENQSELFKLKQSLHARDDGPVELSYLGQIETIRRNNQQRRKYLTVTLSDQILYDEELALTLEKLDATWTIAAPSMISEKLKNFAKKYPRVQVLKAITRSQLSVLLLENDVYLDLNQGHEWENVIEKAYFEGLLVIADQAVAKSPHNELVLTSRRQILDLLSSTDYSAELLALHQKKGKLTTYRDYQEVFE